MPPAPARQHPYAGLNFRVEIDGIAVASFAEVTGLESESAVIEYRTGDARFNSALKLPGLTKYANIVLRRGITRDLSLWQWRKAIVEGKMDRRNGMIVLMDESRADVLRWTFRNGWPCKWQGPSLNAEANEVAIETLEIAHEGLELEGGG
jgi:phage tail-like protein